MKKLKVLLAIVILAVFPMMTLVLPANAATTADVTATVTVSNISVAVTPGTVTYGALAAGASKSTIAAEANAQQTATNNGNVVEDFNIKGNNGTS